MGRTTKGMLTQTFKIEIDVEELREYIVDHIVKSIQAGNEFKDLEIDESYFDFDKLCIKGNYDTGYTHWHCKATLESPEENETEREYIGKSDWLLDEIPKEIKDLIKVQDVEEDEDDVEYGDAEQW